MVLQVDKLPQVGQLIQVKRDFTEAKWYPSRVEDVSNTYISIAAPLEGGVVVPFSSGSKVRVQFEQPDALYSFVSTVVFRRSVETLRIYDLALPDEVSRSQRRQLFRLSLVLPVEYAITFLPEENLTIVPGIYEKAIIRDISGGGVRLVTDLQLPKSTKMNIKLLLEESDLTLTGEIVNIHEQGDQEKERYSYGVKFVDLDYNTQDQIVSFIFEEQRRRRRRELGKES